MGMQDGGAVRLRGTGTNLQEVDTTFNAGRVSVRPLDPGAQGTYSFGGFTGILPAALSANSEVFQFRWTDATRVAVIQNVAITASVSTTFFAAGVPVQVDLVKSTSWSAAGTGGTAIAPAALLKKRSTFASSLVASGDLRIATTAALGAGTKTLETLSLAAVCAGGPITSSLNGTIFPPGTLLWGSLGNDGMHPLVLTQNEGFSIRSVAVPATGTWTMGVTVEWVELASY